MANIEKAQRATGERQATGPRAEFWKLRGLRGNKKNEKNMRRSREDLLQLTIQGKFPAYERVLLREGWHLFIFFNHTLTEILCFMHKGPGLTTFTGFSPANFKRPIVILGPLNDIAMEKLAREMPDDYEVAGWFVLGCFDTPFLFLSIISLLFHLFSSSSILFKIFWVCCYISTEMVPRSGSADGGSTVIKLDTVRRIAEKVSSNIKVMFTVLFSVSVWYFLFDYYYFFPLSSQDKHPLLDITPTAVERLNYIQYHPMVLFLDPHNRKDVKTMRQRYSPKSSKSSRRLYSQAIKMRKHCSHLFSGNFNT